MLAELGALACVDASAGTRRAAVWQVAAVERDARSLFAGADPPAGSDTASPLDEMTPLQETLADYRWSGVTTGPAPPTPSCHRSSSRASACRSTPRASWKSRARSRTSTA